VNLDIDRQRSAADRNRSDEGDVLTCLRPVDEYYWPRALPKKAKRDRLKEEDPITDHFGIAEQSVHSLDAVLRQRAA
jgi:hypothetical protein